jgi:hypothetical protein
MARELETGSTGATGPEVTEVASAPSGELIVRGRTVIDPTAAHDLVVRGVTVIDRGRRSYRSKLVNRGRAVIDERSAK